jgi:hypothetical protein
MPSDTTAPTWAPPSLANDRSFMGFPVFYAFAVERLLITDRTG